MCEQPGTPCPKHDVPAPIPADPERDARVAARRAADARKAGAALDRLLAETWPDRTTGRAYFVKGYREGFQDGWSDGYAASELQHNRHYGVPCPRPAAHMASEYADVRPSGFTGPMHDTCIETTGYGEVLAGTRSWVCGQECPGVAP